MQMAVDQVARTQKRLCGKWEAVHANRMSSSVLERIGYRELDRLER